MSEATIFEFPYNLFLKQRLEFTVLCMDDLEAKIMRVIEYEMIKLKESWQAKCELATEAKKPLPREPRDYWTRLSHSMIIARLYLYDSADLKKPETEDMDSPEWQEYLRKKALSISKSTLRKAINSLIAKGFLLMRSKPGDEFGAPIYTLQRANVQKAMKALPANPYTIFHRGGVSNFESGGEFQNLQVPPPNIETPTSNSANSHFQNLEVDKDITEDSSPDTFEEEGETGAVAPAARAEISDLKEKISDTAARLKAIGKGEDLNSGPGWQASPVVDEEIDPEETVRRHPAFGKGQTDATVHGGADRGAAAVTSGQPAAGAIRGDASGDPSRPVGTPAAPAVPDSAGVAPSQQTVRGAEPPGNSGGATHPLTSTGGDAPPRSFAGASESRAPGARIPKRPKAAPVEPKGPPQMPAEDAAWTTTTCRQLFDALRGVTLIGKYKNMQASECAKGLSERYSRQYVMIAQQVMSEDSYYADRFVDICDVANNITRYKRQIERRLKQSAAPAQEQPAGDTSTDDLSIYGHSGFDVYKGNGPEVRKAMVDYFEEHNLEAMFAND